MGSGEAGTELNHLIRSGVVAATAELWRLAKGAAVWVSSMRVIVYRDDGVL